VLLVFGTHFEAKGVSDETLCAAWRSMVYAMIERIDLGSYRRDIAKTVLDTIRLWSLVQRAHGYEATHPFIFTDSRELLAMYDELRTAAMTTLMATPELPPRDEQERESDVALVDDIVEFARRHHNELNGAIRSGCAFAVCQAGILVTVADSCMTLVGIALGRQFAESFLAQYRQCITAWAIAVPLVCESSES
jgi:hypothetical protein